MHHVTKADGWTLHFPLAITGLTCFHCGLHFWQIQATLVFTYTAILPCILWKVSAAGGSLLGTIQFLFMHIFILWVAYSSIYQQACILLLI